MYDHGLESPKILLFMCFWPYSTSITALEAYSGANTRCSYGIHAWCRYKLVCNGVLDILGHPSPKRGDGKRYDIEWHGSRKGRRGSSPLSSVLSQQYAPVKWAAVRVRDKEEGPCSRSLTANHQMTIVDNSEGNHGYTIAVTSLFRVFKNRRNLKAIILKVFNRIECSMMHITCKIVGFSHYKIFGMSTSFSRYKT